jgi:hypothetical protein
MTDPSQPNSLDERRLALEEQKAKQDYDIELRKLGLDQSDRGWIARLFTPLTATVFAAIITVAGSAIAAFMQARSTIQLEAQKEQHELILKMISVGDEKQARANLKFLATMKLVDNDLARIILESKDIPTAVLPSATSTTVPYQASVLDLIQTDDDAIDAILKFEGGYVEDPINPKSSTNGGIALSQLSTYLNKDATTEDLKSLTKDQIRDFYKKTYFSDNNKFSNVKVRAAYANAAVSSGTAQATKLFQSAAGRVLGRSVVVDGPSGP